MIDHYSYSTLSITCDLALSKRLSRVQKEGIDTDETAEGREIHKIFLRQDWEALKDYGYPDPTIWKGYVGGRDAGREKEFKYMIGNYTIKGRMDTILSEKDKAVVIDIKTQRSYATQPHIHQLRVYALPYLREFREVVTKIYLARYDTFLDVEQLEFSDTGKIENWILHRIHHAEKVMKEKDPKPEPSGYCIYCHHTLSCPVIKDAKIPTTKEEAGELAKLLIVTEAQGKTLKRLLKKWTDENENIITGDKTIGYRLSQMLQIDEEGVLKWCTDNNISPLEFFVAMKSEFIKRCKKYPDLANFGTYIEGKPKFGVFNCKEKL